MKHWYGLTNVTVAIVVLFLFVSAVSVFSDGLPEMLSGKVVTVDAQKKMIIIKTAKGEESVLVREHKVKYMDSEMKFTELKPGDQVKIEYIVIKGQKGTAGSIVLVKRGK